MEQNEKERYVDQRQGVISSDSSATIDIFPKPQIHIPPNGGLRAWLQVLGAFFMYFNTWGIVSSFGSYQIYYEGSVLSTASSFQISTIGSIQSFLMVFLGFIAGPIYDKGYFSHLLGLGSLLIVIGTITQSFCSVYWQFFLAQGVCTGIGMGCIAIPSVAVPSTWFTTNLPLANGIVVSASGFGGVVYPIMIRSLMPLIGFKWTVLCVALIVFVTLGLANIVTRQPTVPKVQRAFLDTSAFVDVPYMLFVVGCFFVFLGLYTPFFYIQSYAIDAEITTEHTALYLVSILNGASVFGRVLPNLPALTAQLGPLNMMVSSVFSLALIVLCLNAKLNLAGLVVLVVMYGFFTGSFFTLQPTIFGRLTQDKKFIGTRIGMAFTVMSVGLLLGAPVSGALLRMSGYWVSWAWSGVCLAAGAGMMVMSRGMTGGWKLTDRI